MNIGVAATTFGRHQKIISNGGFTVVVVGITARQRHHHTREAARVMGLHAELGRTLNWRAGRKGGVKVTKGKALSRVQRSFDCPFVGNPITRSNSENEG